MSVETQASVSQWAAETFGPVGSDFRVATRANEEMAELLRAVGAGADKDKIASEIADVMIVLYRLAERQGLKIDGNPRIEIMAEPEYGSDARLAALANLTLANALLRMDVYGIGPHLGSLVNQLYRLATRIGADLHAEVDKKMVVNRARVWNLDGTGHGYHVRDKAKAP